MPCLGCMRLPQLCAERVYGGAARVEARALRAVGQHLTATVRLTGSLQPKVGVDEAPVRHVRGRGHPRARSAWVAPICTQLPLVRDTVPASVDDHVRIHVKQCVRSRDQACSIVQLVVPKIVLTLQLARVIATWLVLVFVVEAVAVPVALVWAPRALDPQRLVVGHVGCKPSDLVQRKVQVMKHCHELFEVVLPTYPSAVGCIEVYRHRRRLGNQCLQGILDPLLVRRLSCNIPTMRMPSIRCKVGKAVWLQDDHYGKLVLVSLED
mmetsp:Transcript_79802/g.247954  ORF Transcript_79802/g.247954 Transcript_79802/m.247954 type:complete len:266 (-) Transcript_79802:548-1345(-)